MEKNKLETVWEDCCEFCREQETCDVVVARCVNIKGKPCDRCGVCEDFVEIPAFRRMDQGVKKK